MAAVLGNSLYGCAPGTLCSDKVNPCCGNAYRESLRYGAPKSIVDPLVSLLFDLHRLEGLVLSALERVGVEKERLPPPFGTHLAAREEHMASVDAVPDPLEGYTLRSLKQSSCTAREKTDTVSAILKWLETVHPPGPTISTSDRQALTKMLASPGGECSPTYIVDHEMSQEPVCRKERKANRYIRVCSDPADVPSTMECIGSFSEGEMSGAADALANYEQGLAAAIRGMDRVLSSTCSSTAEMELRCHAKWVEKNSDCSQEVLVVPSADVVARNYEERICANDALASCQFMVHNAFLSLEELIEMYTDEAVVVGERELQYWTHVNVLEEEYRVFLELRSRVRKLLGVMRSLTLCKE